MVEKKVIEDFFTAKKLAVAGVSRNPRKFGTVVYKNLKEKGFTVYALNPNLDNINEDKCYPDVSSLPERVEGIVIVTPPDSSFIIAKEAIAQGIRNIWLQQGAESEKVIELCRENDVNCVYGYCIMMFAPPVVSIHKFHRWLSGLFGNLPK